MESPRTTRAIKETKLHAYHTGQAEMVFVHSDGLDVSVFIEDLDLFIADLEELRRRRDAVIAANPPKPVWTP